MNWDGDNPYRNPYRKKGFWSKDQSDEWNSRRNPKELNDMVKKAWEKIEQWVPERKTEPLTLTPDWSDVEKLYKHITRLYKHIAVLHDDIEILKEKVVLMNRQIVLPIIGKKKGLSEKGKRSKKK